MIPVLLLEAEAGCLEVKSGSSKDLEICSGYSLSGQVIQILSSSAKDLTYENMRDWERTRAAKARLSVAHNAAESLPPLGLSPLSSWRERAARTVVSASICYRV